MFSLEQILEWSGGRLVDAGAAAPTSVGVARMAPLRGSGPRDVCFFFSKDYQHELAEARPGILVTGEPFVEPLRASGLPLWKASVIVACADPYLALARISAGISAASPQRESGPAREGIHPTAVVDASAKVGPGASIGPHCVVEADAEIGSGTRVLAGSYIGPGSVIGRDGLVFPRVTVYHGCRIGDRVRLHSGVVIGSDGFGYAPIRIDGKVAGHEKIHHLGGVVIGDDVEIGAGTAVDRGTLGDTVIESLVKIDNLVQVGHNSILRRGAVLCGMSGTAGGSVIGRFAYLGGRAIVINKAEVGDGAMLAADSVVTKDVAAGEQVAGSPHRPLREHLRLQARLSRLVAAPREKKGEQA